MRGRGVSVQVFDVAQIRQKKLGGLIGVGQGSAQTPRFLKLTYSPAGARGKALALVGKGVVFDSGGLSLKPAGGMETMKCDMSGGAAVVAAMSALKDLGVKTKVTGYVPLVENMPSGTAIRPGEAAHPERQDGRGAQHRRRGSSHPRRRCRSGGGQAAAIVDLATLTGVRRRARRQDRGLMGNHDDWSSQVRDAADRVGERVWPLPLPPDYPRDRLRRRRHQNTGPRRGHPHRGLFLQEFVGDVPGHLDIAGPRLSGDDGYITKGGTGFGCAHSSSWRARSRRRRTDARGVAAALAPLGLLVRSLEHCRSCGRVGAARAGGAEFVTVDVATTCSCRRPSTSIPARWCAGSITVGTRTTSSPTKALHSAVAT
jgi:leucyl aminopeptidase